MVSYTGYLMIMMSYTGALQDYSSAKNTKCELCEKSFVHRRSMDVRVSYIVGTS
jgi:hypothetical protein